MLTSILTSGCAGLGATPSPAAPDAATPSLAAEPVAPTLAAHALPEAAECSTVELPELDPRCPVEVIGAAATSWLDLTTAVFDGVEVHVVEYDPLEVAAEAESDPAFARLVVDADSAPRDGILDGGEARDLEARVLEQIDARYAQRYAAR